MLSDPVDIALIVAEVFEELGVPHLIGGSLASSLHGETRSTQDVDFVADMGGAMWSLRLGAGRSLPCRC